MTICLGSSTMLATISTALIGWGTPDNIKTYVSINMDPWDNNNQINFKEPMGSLGIEYDITENFRLFFEHLSSPVQCDDHPGINHAGVKLMYPINDVTLYSGVSANSTSFDSNDDFIGPLLSLGVEYGPHDSYKFYAEHLASFEKFSDGRTSFGLKLFFK